MTKIIPKRAKDAIKVLIGMAVATPVPDTHLSKGFDCPVCNSVDVELRHLPIDLFRELNDHQHVHSFFQYETLNIEHYSCSVCGASDRDRLYALYFRAALADGAKALSVLEIAPVVALTRFLRTFSQVTVRTADLYMSNVDDKIDVTDMRAYADGQFDVFICSHVLEHVDDDIVAMRELHRVLKRGGWGIAMVPIHLGLQRVVEDPSTTDQAMRWKYFGQSDHLRMYSKAGFLDRLKSVGFVVEEADKSYFGDGTFSVHGIHPRSVLYIVRK